MCDGVEKKPVVVEVSGERPITDLGKDVTAEVDTDSAFHLPHQIGAGSESADLAAHGSVERFVEIESGAQSDIGSEPVIVSREGLVQLLVDSISLDLAFESAKKLAVGNVIIETGTQIIADVGNESFARLINRTRVRI